MTAQLIPFEYLALAKETTHGTAIAAATHFTNLFGTLDPQKEYYEPNESSGMLASRTRTKVTRKSATFAADGPLDLFVLPLLLHGIAKGGTITPTTPETATNTRLWTFKPSMNVDNLDTFTLFFGDPNTTKLLQAAYGIIESMTISNDATSTDGATMSVSGVAQYPSLISVPSAPSALFGPLLVGLNMDVYLDTEDPIGTTLLEGKVVSVEHTIDGALVPTYRAGGADAEITYNRHSLQKRGITTSVVIELDGFAEYEIAEEDDTPVKLRVVHNGPEIEDGFNHQLTVDTYGQLRMPGWGDESNTRTMQLEVHSEYDATLGADWQIQVQNSRNTL